MKGGLICCVFFLFLIGSIKGQDTIPMQPLPVPQTEVFYDSALWVANEDVSIQAKEIEDKIQFKPNPTRAVIYSAIFPGLGQIYNRKYWKLPLIYGGFIALAYGFSWNGQYYDDYKDAYRGISGVDPRGNYYLWENMVPNRNPQTISDVEIANYKAQFKRKKDFYRRNRDLCIIGAVALYAACMIDAYVDAHLFDFDISPDLSLKVEPAIMGSSITSKQSFGLQCSIKF